MKTPIEGYFDTLRRTALTDAADGAMRRIVRDVRAALPNSLRSPADGSSQCFEFLPVVGGGRYRVAQSSAAAGDVLDFAAAAGDSCRAPTTSSAGCRRSSRTEGGREPTALATYITGEDSMNVDRAPQLHAPVLRGPPEEIVVDPHREVYALMVILELSVPGPYFRRTVEFALDEALTASVVRCRQEEARMEAAGFAGLQAHCREHLIMLDRLTVAWMHSGEPEALAELLGFLREWWPTHGWQWELD